jgi:MFS family permease
LFILSLIAMAGVLLTIFILIEVRKGHAAMFDISLITKNRLFAAANLSALLNYTAYFGVSFVISFYLQRVLGYSILQTGLILLVMPVTMAVLSPISGWASDRIGSRYLSSGGMVLITIGLILLSTLDSSSTTVPIVAYLFILGLGMGTFSSPNTSAVMGCVEKRQLGVAGGTLATMRTLGQSLSLAIMGAVISTVASTSVVTSLFSGANPSQIIVDSGAFVHGMTYAFLVSAGIAALGAVTSYARGPSMPIVCDASNHSQEH